MQIKDLSVSTKLIGVFGFVLLVSAGLGLFSVYSLAQLDSAGREVRDNWLPSTSRLGRFEYFITRARVAQANYVMADTAEQRATAVANIRSYTADADKAWAEYLPNAVSPEEKVLVEKITTERGEYQPLQEQLDQILSSKGSKEAIAFFMGPMKKEFSDIVAATDADVAFNQRSGTEAADRGADTYQSARIAIWIGLMLTIAISVAAGWVLVRAISQPLRAMSRAMGELAGGNLEAAVPCADQADEIGELAAAMTSFKNQLAEAERAKEIQTREIVASIGDGLARLAEGDLTHRITAELSGAFAKLKADFNTAMARLQETMATVLAATGQISTGAGEISQAADDLSRRTEQQAAALEETAAALEEITASVKSAAANSHEASRTIGHTKDVAEDGGAIVESAIAAMDAIAQSSKQITDIIAVIDEIAFQTNLLALNAGVEAARAGDAGKGFAVVASEVRALAQRSSEAAKQIKTLIQTSGTHVEGGVKLVGESGAALRRIVEQIAAVNELAHDSARAGEQQASGIEQVNAAVSQMDQVTQQNAAMVEQSTAASRNLASETHALADLVGFFKVGASATPPAKAPLKAPAPMTKPRLAARKVANARTVPAAGEWTEF